MRRAALAGFVIGSLPGLIVGVHLARSYLVMHTLDRTVRAMIRALAGTDPYVRDLEAHDEAVSEALLSSRLEAIDAARDRTPAT